MILRNQSELITSQCLDYAIVGFLITVSPWRIVIPTLAHRSTSFRKKKLNIKYLMEKIGENGSDMTEMLSPTSPVGSNPSPWQRLLFYCLLTCSLREPKPKTKPKVFLCQTKANLDVFLISLPSPPWLYSPLSLSFLPSLFCVHRNALLRAEIKGTKDAIDKNDSVPIWLCGRVWLCESGIAVTCILITACQHL